jgi:hypothetical protein
MERLCGGWMMEHYSRVSRRERTGGSHDHVISGRSSDDGLDSKMDFVILIIRLTTRERHDLLLPGQTMLLGHGVVNMPAIHTTQAGRPHLPI